MMEFLSHADEQITSRPRSSHSGDSAGAAGELPAALVGLVAELDGLADGSAMDEPALRAALSGAKVSLADIAPYIEERSQGYARRRIVRRDGYELLVLTWKPGQRSAAHDHAGSICGLKVMQGTLTETEYTPGADGFVRIAKETELHPGEMTVDPGVVVHSLCNKGDTLDGSPPEVLVTMHVYAPPLPEMRRYAVTREPPAEIYLRDRAPSAKTVAIVGGGFTGTMAMANLLREAEKTNEPLHIVLLDCQAAVGEGVAYRTDDGRHLLNVPCGRMSAWADRPDDFLNYAKGRNPAVVGGDYLPRKMFGPYVRQNVEALARAAGPHVSVEVVREQATRLSPIGDQGSAGWDITTCGGRSFRADVAIVTVGHRPPDDVCARKWTGSQKRLVGNPWATLTLTQVRPDESVLLLGSGLTAIDAILTLNRPDRTAPLYVVSRRGLMPLPHSRHPKPPADVAELLKGWLDPAKPVAVRELVASLRKRVTEAQTAGQDWRQVIDGLRPAISAIWERLGVAERSRFLTHVRPFWEIHRHRMAPQVAQSVESLRSAGLLHVSAGSLISAAATDDGVDVTLSTRRSHARRIERVNWVVNCTGPGIQSRHSTHPILMPLLEAGLLVDDEFSLGLKTDPAGRCLTAEGGVLGNLFLAGTLRKATLWESTAVPELRLQAAAVAEKAMACLANR